jgi:hypothetical protein
MAEPPESSMSQSNTDDATGFQTVVQGGTNYFGEIHVHGAGHSPISPSSHFSDIAPYLAALCQHYRQWQTLYTLTDVEGKQKIQESLSCPSGQPFEFEGIGNKQ